MTVFSSRKPTGKIPTRVTNTNMTFASADLLFSAVPHPFRFLKTGGIPSWGKPPVLLSNCLLWQIMNACSVARVLMRVKPVTHFVLMAMMRWFSPEFVPMMMLVMVFKAMRMIAFMEVVFVMGRMLVGVTMMSMFVLMVLLVFVFPVHNRFSYSLVSERSPLGASFGKEVSAVERSVNRLETPGNKAPSGVLVRISVPSLRIMPG